MPKIGDNKDLCLSAALEFRDAWDLQKNIGTIEVDKGKKPAIKGDNWLPDDGRRTEVLALAGVCFTSNQLSIFKDPKLEIQIGLGSLDSTMIRLQTEAVLPLSRNLDIITGARLTGVSQESRGSVDPLIHNQKEGDRNKLTYQYPVDANRNLVSLSPYAFLRFGSPSFYGALGVGGLFEIDFSEFHINADGDSINHDSSQLKSDITVRGRLGGAISDNLSFFLDYEREFFTSQNIFTGMFEVYF